jgi:hypothetical protein
LLITHRSLLIRPQPYRQDNSPVPILTLSFIPHPLYLSPYFSIYIYGQIVLTNNSTRNTIFYGIFEVKMSAGFKYIRGKKINLSSPPVLHTLSLILLFAACEDTPPDPNPPYVPPDGMYNITQLTDAISSRPEAFDTSDFIKMKGSWQDFSSRQGEVSAYDDPLGKLYYALVKLDANTTRKIMLDFSNVSGRSISDSTPVNSTLSSRPARNAIKALIFPADMQSIGAYSFAGCGSLEEVIFQGESRPVIGIGAFPENTPLIDKTAEYTFGENK